MTDNSSNEAGGIVFCDMWTPEGGKICITERADTSLVALEELMLTVAHAEKQFGLSLAPDFSKVVKSAPAETESGVLAVINTPPTADRNKNPTIQVSNIKLASGGEHPRWVVQGGNFTKFGITCWPEVLEDAGIAEHLDPLTDNLPEGQWLAYYIENAQGKPDKVTKLVRQ